MMDLTTSVSIEIVIGTGIILTLYLIVLWWYVHKNRKIKEDFVKEIVELSIGMAKLRDLLEQKDKEIEKLQRMWR